MENLKILNEHIYTAQVKISFMQIWSIIVIIMIIRVSIIIIIIIIIIILILILILIITMIIMIIIIDCIYQEVKAAEDWLEYKILWRQQLRG